jgi:hypothetical protein
LDQPSIRSWWKLRNIIGRMERCLVISSFLAPEHDPILISG